MANELTSREETMVALVESNEIGDLIKPLVKEIHLFDSYIAGTGHLEDVAVIDALKVGDMLHLQREENKFDDNAILILNDAKQKLGYVPEKDNLIFARLMDAGKLLKAKVTKIDRRGSFRQIAVGIYLVDF